MNNITVANYIHRELYKRNIKYVFGYSGGAVLPLLNEFRCNKIKFIKNSTEQCSGFVSEGYSKSKNLSIPGVVVTTSGPGLTNMITPLQNAYSDGSPLVVISGQVPMKSLGTDAFQECPATYLTKHCTKWNKLITDKEEIIEAMNMAFNISMSERKGPVHIDIPKDIFLERINVDNNNIINYSIINNWEELDIGKNLDIKIKELCELIDKSEKPIIIAGQGANEVSKELNKFVGSKNIPITTTLHGMGCVNEKSKMSLEMLGMHGKPVANYAIQNADLIIGLGTRFDDRTVCNIEKYAPNAIKNNGIIHIDSSSDQLFKVQKLFNYKNLKSIHTNSKLFMKKLNRYYVKTKSDKWINELIEYDNNNKYYYNRVEREIKTPDVIKCIDENIDKFKLNRNNIIFTTGVGNHQMWTSQYITWTSPNKLITSGSLGTMGVGVPFAIGCKLANPEKMVICIDGDSSFTMTSNELQTILENKIPIKIAIMNDKRQQMVHVWQKLFHNENYVATDNINPDFKLLGQAYNIKTIECSNRYSLDNKVKQFLATNEPVIGVFNVKPEMCFPLVAPGKGLDDMIMNENDISKLDITLNAPN